MAFQGTSERDGCRPRARVRLYDKLQGEGTEVPWVNDKEGNGGVEVQIGKTGESDLTRSGEVHVPYEWGGDDVLSAITDNTNKEDVLKLTDKFGVIEVLNSTNDVYVPVHNGPLTAVGPSQVDGCFRIFVDDWANIIATVAADFEMRNPTLEDVFNTVVRKLKQNEATRPINEGVNQNESTKIFEGNRVPTIFENPTARVLFVSGEVLDLAADLAFSPLDANDELLRRKTFNKFDHDLTDVLDWATDSLNYRWAVVPIEDTPFLMVFQDIPTSFEGRGLAYDGLSSNVAQLVSNNALFEISPQHTLGVRGEKTTHESGTTVDIPLLDPLFDEVEEVGGTSVSPNERVVRNEAIIEHEVLADIAGRNDAPKFHSVKAEKKQPLVNAGKKKLKTALDGASGGEMVALQHGELTPYATISARPICNGTVDRKVPKLTYEIEEVIHDIVAPTTDSDVEGPTTLIRCGFKSDIDNLRVRSFERVTV